MFIWTCQRKDLCFSTCAKEKSFCLINFLNSLCMVVFLLIAFEVDYFLSFFLPANYSYYSLLWSCMSISFFKPTLSALFQFVYLFSYAGGDYKFY